jgi:transposase
VLRTGCQWKTLPKERFGSPSSVHGYFREWLFAGFFLNLWKAGLSEYDELKGIEWSWLSIDGSMVKAPLARDSVRRNPTDRGEKGPNATSSWTLTVFLSQWFSRELHGVTPG